jgi:hypothetical protein
MNRTGRVSSDAVARSPGHAWKRRPCVHPMDVDFP